jgi:hypothetical protein
MTHNEGLALVQPWLGPDADILTSGSGRVSVGLWLDPRVDFRCVADGVSVQEAVANAQDSWAEYRSQVEQHLPEGVAFEESVGADQYQMDADADEAADAIVLYRQTFEKNS